MLALLLQLFVPPQAHHLQAVHSEQALDALRQGQRSDKGVDCGVEGKSVAVEDIDVQLLVGCGVEGNSVAVEDSDVQALVGVGLVVLVAQLPDPRFRQREMTTLSLAEASHQRLNAIPPSEHGNSPSGTQHSASVWPCDPLALGSLRWFRCLPRLRLQHLQHLQHLHPRCFAAVASCCGS